MPLSTYLGVSEAEEIIPTELVNRFVQGYNYTVPVGMFLAWARPGQGNVPIKFPRWNELDGGSGVPAGTKSETVAFDDVMLDLAEESITPGLVGYRLPISDEAIAGADQGLPLGAVTEGIRGLVNRMDFDSLSVSTSATQTVGAVTDDYTLAKHRAAVAFYTAKEIPPSPLGVGMGIGHTAAAALLESLGSSAATMLMNEADSIRFGTQSGFMGTLHDVALFRSGNIATESTGHSQPMTPIGAGASGLGIVLNELPNIRRTRGDDGEARATTYWVCRAWYGNGMTNRTRLVEVLSK